MNKTRQQRILINDHCGHPFQVQLSRALARRGYTVLHTYCASLLTPRGSLVKRQNDPAGFDSAGISLDGDFEKYALLRRWKHERELGRRLAATVRAFAPDVVISSNTPLGTQSLLQIETRRAGAGFVYWMQDALGVGYRTALRRRLSLVGDLLGAAFQAYERQLLARSDEIVVITDDFLSYLPRRARVNGATTVIENWAPLGELTLADKDNDWSKTHGLNGTTNFLYSGTLGLKHNPELLSRLAKAMAARPEVRVVVISEGPGAEWLAERKRQERLDNLVLLPFQPFADMPKVLASAEVLLALLEKDAGAFAVPSKVLTYLCARRPLLLAVPAENLSAKIVRDNAAGISVAPDDVEGFVLAGFQMLDDQVKRDTYAANGRAYAERTFDIDLITDRFEEIIHRIGLCHMAVGRAKIS